jgi:hypothetical protein
MKITAKTLLAVALFLLAALLYSQFGFNGKLARDDAIWLYGGQQMAQGVAPYVSIFDFKSPLGPMLAGVAAWAANQTGSDDIFCVRLTFFLLSCLTVTALYYWAFTLFRSHGAAILTAVVFICFWGFARHAGSGPQAKTAMVLFQVLALNFIARRKWFWAGLTGSLAAWAWQPAAIFPLAALLLALAQNDRWRGCRQVLIGGLAPSLIIVGYFLGQRSVTALWQGAVLFNFQQLHRGMPLAQHLKTMAHTLADAFPLWVYALVVGFVMMLFFYFSQWRKNSHSFVVLLKEDPFAGLLLTFPLPVLWSLRDFQGYDDFFIFLPFMAVGIAAFLHTVLCKLNNLRLCYHRAYNPLCLLLCMAFLLHAASFYRQKRKEIGSYLVKQKEWARQIEASLPPTRTLMSIGTPELMVMTHRRNSHRFLYIVEGIDDLIDQETPGGFAAWLQQIEKADPAIIGFKYAPGRFMNQLQAWLRSRYEETRVGDWTVYRRENAGH